MTGDGQVAVAARTRSGRRELSVLLLGGVVGAGLVLFATRQQFARVVITAPRPLPVTSAGISGQDLLPAAAALAVAALASMAAVMATRGVLRRVTGLVTAGLGVGIAALAAGPISAARVLAAVTHANLSPASGAGGGTAPGSTTAGSDASSAAGSLSGFPSHVDFAGAGWRWLIVFGAVVIAVTGLVVVVRATRLPVMSSRYERAGRSAAPAPQRATAASGAVSRGSAASMWESLTGGADPTVRPDDESPG